MSMLDDWTDEELFEYMLEGLDLPPLTDEELEEFRRQVDEDWYEVE